MKPKRTYRLADIIPEEISEKLSSFGPLTKQLLYQRGIVDEDSARIYLAPDYDLHLHNPFLLTDMERAVDRILLAIKSDEHVVIYTDYDCDGIPGGVLLHDFFEAIGFKNFENHIPHRHHDGYGFNAESVPQFKMRNTKLIITVDCGITDHEATRRAQDEGIDVIITDHHEPQETLPPAYAIVNPKRDDAYPFKGLSGTGVAYKLVQAILAKGKEQNTITLKDGMEKWWLDMVGIATIADMVPLVGENRVLAQYGLSVLRKSQRPGLQQLLRKAGGSQRYLTEDDIGFTIAPRINAASRMDDPEDAFHMLRTKDESEAGERVAHLEKLNNERKGVVAAMTKEAKKRMNMSEEIPTVIVMGNPEWRPSLVGLVAGSLASEYNRPAFLWGRDGKGAIKGSCRSDGVTSILHIMENTPESFITFGGHHVSGGFSVLDEKIHTLGASLTDAYHVLGAKASEEGSVTTIDADLTLGDVSSDLLRMLTALAPFGEANPKPLFRFRDVVPETVFVFGKTKNHTKLKFKTERNRYEALAFFKTPDQFDVIPEVGKPLTLIAHVEQSYYMGRMETRLRIVDIV